MKGSKTAGRNAPCPCGSGKKYKKCCYEKSAVTNTRYHSLPDYAQINYATPILDENFFRSNTLREMSAPRLLYSILLMPEVEEIAERVSRKYILRGLEERQAIDDAQDIEQLIQIMQRKPDTLNHRKLINKVLGFNEKAILLIIEKLKEPQNDVFIDIAVRAIYSSGENYSNEILDRSSRKRAVRWERDIHCAAASGFLKPGPLSTSTSPRTRVGCAIAKCRDARL